MYTRSITGHIPVYDIAEITKSESVSREGKRRNFSNEPTLRVSCAFGAPRLANPPSKALHISKVVGRGEQFGLLRVSGIYVFSLETPGKFSISHVASSSRVALNCSIEHKKRSLPKQNYYIYLAYLVNSIRVYLQ